MDSFALADLTDNKPLSTLGKYLFDQLGLIDLFEIDTGKLARFFDTIEQGYDDGKLIPYHNRIHAASVVHMMHMLLSHGGVAQAVSPSGTSDDRGRSLLVMACLLAAAAHDYEHKGVNNDFLVRTGNE